MALQRFIVTAILFNWALKALAYPHAKDLQEVRSIDPWTLSGVIPQLSVPTNSTNAPPRPPRPPAPIGVIQCFQQSQSHVHTDVDGCRPTLNYIRTFPNYRRVQDFMEERYPKIPSKPPYAIHHEGSNCALQIASDNPLTIDDFSFEQARALATEILEVCQDRGGRGGFAPIGHGVGWRVCVIGFKLGPGPPVDTSLLEEVGLRNGTSLPVAVVEA